MKNIPRILPLVGVAAVGVLSLNALSGARDLPSLLTGARAFAEEAVKGVSEKADLEAIIGEEKDAAALPPPSITPKPVCAPTAAELARQAGLSPAELQILQSLGDRRGQLDKREDDLETQLALIAAAEAKLDAKMKALNGLKGEVQGLLTQVDTKEQAEIARLITVYQNMKARDAAPRFSQLDENVRLQIAAGMTPRALSAIMAQMSPADAKSVTEGLARRFGQAREAAERAQQAAANAPQQQAQAPAQPAAQPRPRAANANANRPARAPANQQAAQPAPAPAATPAAKAGKPRSLRQVLRTGVAAACIATVAAPSGIIAPAAQAQVRGGLEVRVAQSEQFSRVEFRGASATARREGQYLILSFARDGDPDISRLRTSPPKWIKTAEKRRNGGRLEVVIALTDDAEATTGTADGATYVNVFERPPQQVAQAEVQVVEAEPPRPNPVPPGGVVKMESSTSGGQVQFTFNWANPAGAAVYRRGNAIWLVFDASATLDVSSAPTRMRQFSTVKAYKGADYSAIRIDAPDEVPVFINSLGSTWTLSLGPGGQALPGIVRVSREEGGGPPMLRAPLAGATRVIQFPDAEAGDIITIVTALGPAKGVASRRDFVQLSMLPSIHGLAIEGHVDNLFVQREGDIVRMGRPDGLTLSPMWATRDRAQAALGAPKAAAMPALIDETWRQTGEGGFLARYNSLFAAAASEGANKDREAPVTARMALARFLVGSDLSFEAIGVLNDLSRQHPEMLDEPEFRGLRGMARVLARRFKEAEADLAAPPLADDPSAALWRSYVASQLAQYPEARALFAKGAESFGSFPAIWKARFARAEAHAALAQGDLAGADARIRLALAEPTDSAEELATRLLQAQLVEKQGHKDRALKIYEAVARAPMDYLSGPALLGATNIRLELGRITPLQAVNVYDGLRYRWRGDSTELSVIRSLGQLYLNQGRYREALEALRTAGGRLPDLPEALQLQSDLAAAFRALFLDGMADGLEPVQALALFYDFKELTPIGADGDLMVRRLVRRLVDVDLLPQAAELLKYQAENRLDGVPRAQVATDLALIYLMDRKPEQALQAINSSRTTVLPTALNNERRLIEARAWSAVGRFDSALEIIEKDASKEAGDLRAEITWKQKNWQAAGPLFEKALGDRWRNPAALTSEEEGRLLRAGVAYSMAGDSDSLQRLEAQYGSFYEKSNNPEALRIALSGVPNGPLTVGDFGRVSADSQAFEGWVAGMKAKFRNRPSPTSNGAPVRAQQQAQAATTNAPATGRPATAAPTPAPTAAPAARAPATQAQAAPAARPAPTPPAKQPAGAQAPARG